MTRPGVGTRRFHLTGTEEKVKANIKHFESQGDKIKIVDPSYGQHYELTLVKDGKTTRMLGYGDKDKLQKKFADQGYEVKSVKPLTIPPQPKGYNVFNDEEVKALLRDKGVPPDTIKELAQTKMRGTAPVSAGREIKQGVRLTPYYTRFSSN